jgi:hypothetical protein
VNPGNFHYELPDGTRSISCATIEIAHGAGLTANSGKTNIKIWDADKGKYVPSYLYEPETKA